MKDTVNCLRQRPHQFCPPGWLGPLEFLRGPHWPCLITVARKSSREGDDRIDARSSCRPMAICVLLIRVLIIPGKQGGREATWQEYIISAHSLTHEPENCRRRCCCGYLFRLLWRIVGEVSSSVVSLRDLPNWRSFCHHPLRMVPRQGLQGTSTLETKLSRHRFSVGKNEIATHHWGRDL